LAQKGIVFWPSAANYILCYFEDPVRLERQLRDRGILVRPKKDAEGTLGLRVSLGTLAQTERLIATLEEVLTSPPA
jgi:histidinol-phosphate aminotransferase